eukprot:1212926-Prymnesium_polylepis.1
MHPRARHRRALCAASTALTPPCARRPPPIPVQVEEQMRAELQHHSVLPASPRRSPSRPQTAPSQRLAFAPGVELSPQRPVEVCRSSRDSNRSLAKTGPCLDALGCDGAGARGSPVRARLADRLAWQRTMMATEYARPYSPSSGSLGSLGGTQRHGLARDVPNRGEVLSLEDITILKLR